MARELTAKPGEARNFDGFNYAQYLRTQKIHWMVKVKGSDLAKVTRLTAGM